MISSLLSTCSSVQLFDCVLRRQLPDFTPFLGPRILNGMLGCCYPILPVLPAAEQSWVGRYLLLRCLFLIHLDPSSYSTIALIQDLRLKEWHIVGH